MNRKTKCSKCLLDFIWQWNSRFQRYLKIWNDGKIKDIENDDNDGDDDDDDVDAK